MLHISAERLAALQAMGGGLQDNPMLAWDNLMRRALLSGDPVAADGALQNAATWTTYDRWRPEGSGARRIEALIGAEEAPVSFLALAAHNLAAIGASVQWAYALAETGGAWVDLAEIPAEPGVMAWRFAPLAARRWRLTVSVPAGKAAHVGCLFIGAETILPTRVYAGFAPRIRPTEIDLDSNISEGGNLLGTAVVRMGSTLGLDLAYLPAEFVRGPEFGRLIDWYNWGRGLYLAWRPAKYPQDLHYGWRSGSVLRPQNSGPQDFMSAGLAMRLFDG